jgi:two-component system response regulator AtoC
VREGASPGAARVERCASTFVIGEHTVLVADPDMLQRYELIERLARTRLPILIVGESGVGKENVARAVHAWSPWAAAPLIALDCAALQGALIEAELFGYERGAVPGAVTGKPGVFERAIGGTLFLDKVNELSEATQARLLRVLEGERGARIGGTLACTLEVRIVAATTSDLTREVTAGRFRSDLHDHLSGATVVLPPLRARRRELPILAQYFLAAARLRTGGVPTTISNAAMRRLLAHPWPGNIRELKHAMEYAAALVDGAHVEPRHLPVALAQAALPAVQARRPAAGLRVVPAGGATALARGTARFRPIAEELRALEQRRMAEALRATGGVQRRAAELIGMSVRTFASKLAHYGLRERARPQPCPPRSVPARRSA